MQNHFLTYRSSTSPVRRWALYLSRRHHISCGLRRPLLGQGEVNGPTRGKESSDLLVRFAPVGEETLQAQVS
jgi:hypothetical protein